MQATGERKCEHPQRQTQAGGSAAASCDCSRPRLICQLKQVFKTALQSYLTELDKVTLADVTRPTSSSQLPGSRRVSRVSVSEIKRPLAKKSARSKAAPDK